MKTNRRTNANKIKKNNFIQCKTRETPTKVSIDYTLEIWEEQEEIKKQFNESRKKNLL